MNGISNPIIFYPIAILMIFFAILTIKFRNIFYSLLSAIMVFFLTGLIFYILGSEYNAVIQIAVYGVAVPIILALAIMFTETTNVIKENLLSNLKLKILLITVGIFFILSMLVVLSTSSFYMTPFEGINSYNTINAFAEGIFSNYVLAFEFISLILTIVVVGLTLFDKKQKDMGEEICKK